MKYFTCVFLFSLLAGIASVAFAWDGFDAETIELVEIVTNSLPPDGETIDIKNHDTGATCPGIVQSLKHNASTIEIVVRYPDDSLHTLVMEGR